MEKQILDEIKFAFDNGFTTFKKDWKHNEVTYQFSFGVVIADKELSQEIDALIDTYSSYTQNEMTVVDKLQELFGYEINDLVATKTRTMTIEKIHIVKTPQRNNGNPEYWIYVRHTNGSYSIVNEKTLKKYKKVS